MQSVRQRGDGEPHQNIESGIATACLKHCAGAATCAPLADPADDPARRADTGELA